MGETGYTGMASFRFTALYNIYRALINECSSFLLMNAVLFSLQLAELETLEKDSRDKNRKIERKNADLLQTNRRLESRNKMLLDEINTMVRV